MYFPTLFSILWLCGVDVLFLHSKAAVLIVPDDESHLSPIDCADRDNMTGCGTTVEQPPDVLPTELPVISTTNCAEGINSTGCGTNTTSRPGPPPGDCKQTLSGITYQGSAYITKDGYKCDRWDEADNLYGYTEANFMEDTMTEAKDYCRNPMGTAYNSLWCYTSENDLGYDDCDVPLCPGFHGHNIYGALLHERSQAGLTIEPRMWVDMETALPSGNLLGFHAYSHVMDRNKDGVPDNVTVRFQIWQYIEHSDEFTMDVDAFNLVYEKRASVQTTEGLIHVDTDEPIAIDKDSRIGWTMEDDIIPFSFDDNTETQGIYYRPVFDKNSYPEVDEQYVFEQVPVKATFSIMAEVQNVSRPPQKDLMSKETTIAIILGAAVVVIILPFVIMGIYCKVKKGKFA